VPCSSLAGASERVAQPALLLSSYRPFRLLVEDISSSRLHWSVLWEVVGGGVACSHAGIAGGAGAGTTRQTACAALRERLSTAEADRASLQEQLTVRAWP